MYLSLSVGVLSAWESYTFGELPIGVSEFCVLHHTIRKEGLVVGMSPCSARLVWREMGEEAYEESGEVKRERSGSQTAPAFL